MGLLDLLRRMFTGRGGDGDVGAQPISPARFDVVELARRLEMPVEQIRNTPLRYVEFTIPKRGGGARKISAPDKAVVLRMDARLAGLVVNDGVGLPRRTRRWLRAVRHHAEAGRPATLTDQQLAGWDALEEMVRQQA